MKLGVELVTPTPEPEKYHNGGLHPCVRYIEGGFCGYDWWLVFTPMYGESTSNAKLENPILFKGHSREGGEPPLEWEPVKVVEDTPASGYNSDPCLFFKDGKLWVFWRECWTPSLTGISSRGVFGCCTSDGVIFSEKRLFAANSCGGWGDDEMCPEVIEIDGEVVMLASYYRFNDPRQPYGLAKWVLDGSLDEGEFVRERCIPVVHRKGFDFWHFDVFKHDDKYYSVVTPASGKEILLGESDDGENFKFWGTPLLSNEGTERRYFYKPSAMVLDGVFYLWHPVMVETGVWHQTIWMAEMDFNEVLRKLKENQCVIK